MKRVCGLILLLAGSFSALLHAQNVDYLPADQAAALGMTPAQAFQTYGAPSYLFIEDGPASWQDDIVFYYQNHSYMYWFNSRVWQIRFDHRHLDPIFGVNMASTMEAVRAILGRPLSSSDSELLYPVAELDFPVRAKFVFSNEGLINVYIYRSDF